MKTAIVTGVTGQDGAYLSKLLLTKGYRVIGGARRNASGGFWRLDELGITEQIEFVELELAEQSNIFRTIEKFQPSEFYNLAAQSFVGSSFDNPIYTADVDALGVNRILEAIRTISPETRFYQASTSELYGRNGGQLQDENTAFHPCSPYAVSKLFAHWTTKNYREGYGLHASNGILFNHESPLRGLEFVTRKITYNLALWKLNKIDYFELGNLEATRDWGFAGDYVEAMWLMLQQETPEDYVIATGQTTSIKEFLILAANVLGIDLVWEGSGVELCAKDRESGRLIMKTNPIFYRPVEVNRLIGDATKARTVLSWQPHTNLQELVRLMMEADLKRAEANKK